MTLKSVHISCQECCSFKMATCVYQGWKHCPYFTSRDISHVPYFFLISTSSKKCPIACKSLIVEGRRIRLKYDYSHCSGGSIGDPWWLVLATWQSIIWTPPGGSFWQHVRKLFHVLSGGNISCAP